MHINSIPGKYISLFNHNVFPKNIKLFQLVYPLSYYLAYCYIQSKTEKEKKVIQIRKEELKLFLLVDDTILFIENSKDFFKKLLH